MPGVLVYYSPDEGWMPGVIVSAVSLATMNARYNCVSRLTRHNHFSCSMFLTYGVHPPSHTWQALNSHRLDKDCRYCFTVSQSISGLFWDSFVSLSLVDQRNLFSQPGPSSLLFSGFQSDTSPRQSLISWTFFYLISPSLTKNKSRSTCRMSCIEPRDVLSIRQCAIQNHKILRARAVFSQANADTPLKYTQQAHVSSTEQLYTAIARSMSSIERSNTTSTCSTSSMPGAESAILFSPLLEATVPQLKRISNLRL